MESVPLETDQSDVEATAIIEFEFEFDFNSLMSFFWRGQSIIMLKILKLLQVPIEVFMARQGLEWWWMNQPDKLMIQPLLSCPSSTCICH